MQSKKQRVLYVDDDAENSFILESLLRHASYEAVTVNYASDALQFARGESFDLFVLSKRFPIGSGVYLCHKLHEIAPQTPILFLSNEADGFDLGEKVSSGSQEYVLNCGDAHEVIENVHHLLSQQTVAAEAIF